MAPYKKILIVEDNPINRATLRKILEDHYVVQEAENGQVALNVLHSQSDISLVLLDLMMPVMNGYEFLEAIQDDQLLASIPIIVTTQNNSEADELHSLAAGATDFVSKPYRPQIILHRIASILRLKEAVAILRVLQHDALTGLYSKEYFFHCVQEELLEHPEKKYNLICSDIENFKLVNDAFGMQAGDRLLQEVASLFKEQVDIRGGGICARFGSDKFICMMERKSDYTEEFFTQLKSKFGMLPLPKNLSIKWGIYEIEELDVPVSHMCDRAFLAVNSIKGQYGKSFSIYDNDMRNKMLHEQAIVDCMESALANGEFHVYLQPKYRLTDNSLAGAEALVRWEHPLWGVVSPAEFIPLFEKNGFITHLDQNVWGQTCALLRAWRDQGRPTLPISVNVSRADMYQIDLADCMQSIVKKYDLTPADIHLEITESAFTDDPDQVISTVSRLRNLGFKIEMDDFGSGYSSLNMLSQMTLDILKLDMQFVRDKSITELNEGILKFIIDLAKKMGLDVTAEGVETQEQADWLRENGCDYVQGYLFAKPMKHDAFEKLLEEATVAS